MSVSNRDKARVLAVGLLLTLSFTIFPSGTGQVSPTNFAILQNNSLALTINPERSVGVAWNTTATLPSGPTPPNINGLFPSGYKIHSSSSFSQQSNAVVQTSTVQYQLPAQLGAFVNTISLTANQTGLTGQGSLTISTSIPSSSINVTYFTSLTKVEVNASAQVSLGSPISVGPLSFLANQTAFNNKWTSTFGNKTWTGLIITQIQNATNHLVTVTAFNGTLTFPNTTTAKVSIGFVAQPSSTAATDFVIVLEKILAGTMTPFPSGLDSIIRSALSLETGETLALSYTSSTNTLIVNSTTKYVSDLDLQVNNLKDQFFQLSLSLAPTGMITPATVLFLNSTYVTVSQISITSDFDLSTFASSMTLKGLFFKPPTVGSNTNFTIPGMFKTIGKVPSPGVNLTLVGGSNATYQVKIIIPSGTPAPSSTTANSATWTNVQDASTLSAVRFMLVPISGGLLAFLISPTGIAIEAIGAAAIAGGIVLFLRTRRAKALVPITTPGPEPTRGLGPSPALPTVTGTRVENLNQRILYSWNSPSRESLSRSNSSTKMRQS